jgi:hypothetical protein
MYTISQIFSSAIQPFSAAKAGAIRSQVEVVKNAMSAMTSEITLVESRSVIPLVPALFYGDQIYSIPQTTVDKIIDLKPMKGISIETSNPEVQASRVLSNDTKNLLQYISMEYRDGQQYLNIQQNLQNIAPITLSNCDSDTGVTASLDASNLAVNTLYARNTSALDFDLGTANGSGVLTFEIESTDISAITRDGTLQMQVDVPEALVGKLTNIKITLANEVGFTNTAVMTATTNAFGSAFQYGYQPVQFSYRGKTEAGTFDETAITYMKVEFTHTLTTAVTGVRIDSIQALKGIGYELHFYNQRHFINSAGVLLLEPASTTDRVIVNQEAKEILIQECRKLIDFELRGEDAGQQYQLSERQLMGIYPNAGLYEKYRLKYPAEILVEVSDY